jgi:hypothetical protein
MGSDVEKSNSTQNIPQEATKEATKGYCLLHGDGTI